MLSIEKILPLVYTMGAFQGALLAVSAWRMEMRRREPEPVELTSERETPLSLAEGALIDLRALVAGEHGAEQQEWLLKFVSLELSPFLRRVAILRAALRGEALTHSCLPTRQKRA